MKKIIISVILAGFAFINAQAASCKEEKIWYIQGTGSYGWHNKSRLTFADHRVGSLHSHQPGFGGALAIGYIIDCWRIELEGSHRTNPSKAKYGHKSNTSLMANAYYDLGVTDLVSIYLGAGAGISSVNGKIPSSLQEDLWIDEFLCTYGNSYACLNKFLKKKSGHLDTVFAWQIMAGMTYALSDSWDLVGGYRLFATTKPTLAEARYGSQKLKINNIPLIHNIELGLRFKF